MSPGEFLSSFRESTTEFFTTFCRKLFFGQRISTPARNRGPGEFFSRQERVTEEKYTKLATGGVSRGLPVASEGQPNQRAVNLVFKGWSSTNVDQMRSSPKDTFETRPDHRTRKIMIASYRTVKQILSCHSKHSRRLLIIATLSRSAVTGTITQTPPKLILREIADCVS